MARIIHFGEDSCHRLMVFEGVGYAVERCESIQDLDYYLSLRDRPCAVIISGESHGATRICACLANAELPVPVILFAGTDELHTEWESDLVIPALTPPSEWLSRIEETIERFQSQVRNFARANTQHTNQQGLL